MVGLGVGFVVGVVVGIVLVLVVVGRLVALGIVVLVGFWFLVLVALVALVELELELVFWLCGMSSSSLFRLRCGDVWLGCGSLLVRCLGTSR